MLERLLRSAVTWAFMAVYWTTVITIHFICLKRLPPAFLATAAHLWGRIALKTLGIHLEIQNDSTISEQAARVVIVNHQSALDLVWGAVICPPAPLGIGKKEVIYVPIFNLIWWGLDFIRIDRSNHALAVKALEGVAETIARERRSLIIAPEGTRTPDGSILKFKKGAFLLARQAKVPIYPVVVSGVFELLPKGSIIPKKGVIKLRFLPPVSTDGLTKENEPEFIARVREEMIRAYRELSR
jgi:1-acyl-sn-glycerol-3-phosphate acyltransferase